MYVQDLIEVLCAAHLAVHVEGPFKERGGIMLVGPPGALKSTFLEQLGATYPDCLVVTDLNAKALTQLRDRVAAGNINTIVFPEYAKIYERKDDTSRNLEGALRAMVAEGFTAAAFEAQGVNSLRARACVIGALTPAEQRRRFERWEESGFNRRFLWPLIRLKDPAILEMAVLEWQRLNFKLHAVPQAPTLGGIIPNRTTREQRARLRLLAQHQPGGSSLQHIQTLTKILAVLTWWYGETENPRDPMQVLEAFGAALGTEGVAVEMTPMPRSTKRRVRQREESQQVKRAAQVLSRRAAALREHNGKRRK